MSGPTATRRAGALAPLDEPLAAEWERLHDSCAASPFLHPGLVRLWADAFDAGPITLATSRRDGELVGALPLLRRGSELVSAADWHTVETGLLARDDAAAAALAATLFQSRAAQVELSFLDQDAAVTARAAAVAARYRVHEQVAISSPYLELDGDWEQFQAAQPSRRRSDRRRLRRRLEERGAVTFACEQDPTRLEPLLALEAQGWKAERGTAIAQRADTRRYYAALAEWAAERGWLRIGELRLDGEVIASSLALQAHGVVYGMKMGYETTLRRFGLGVLLLEDVVRQAFADGATRFELLGGDDRYKRDYASGTRERISLRAFAPSIRGRVAGVRAVHGPVVAQRLRQTLRRGRTDDR